MHTKFACSWQAHALTVVTMVLELSMHYTCYVSYAHLTHPMRPAHRTMDRSNGATKPKFLAAKPPTTPARMAKMELPK